MVVDEPKALGTMESVGLNFENSEQDTIEPGRIYIELSFSLKFKINSKNNAVSYCSIIPYQTV